MSHSIYTQNLAVWYKQDPNRRETLTYKLQSITPDQPSPPRIRRKTHWAKVKRCIDAIQFQVHNLLGRAVFRVPRDDAEVESAAHDLMLEVLPPDGFVGLVGRDVHPSFDISGDETEQIPWEVLAEEYYACPVSGCTFHTNPLTRPDEEHPCCRHHPEELKPAGGKLAITYHLSHLVPCEGRATGRGRRFLIVEDPRGDLTDPKVKCSALVSGHCEKLRKLLKKRGYDVRTLAGSFASCEKVVTAISDPELAGIYYFGHGRLPDAGRPSSLVLADGELEAGDIDECQPTASFVFLNACEAAAVPPGNGIEETGSVAAAFSRAGPGKVVIAPIWPIVTDQAAESAMIFFESACVSAVPLSESLRAVRMKSLQEYNNNKPHTAWLSYRYFGDPNQTLAAQSLMPGKIARLEQPDVQHDRVFGDSGHLVPETFGFDIDDILIRAAKRRMLQDRESVDVADLIAGLVRRGTLTRYAIKQSGQDPDNLYAKIGEHKNGPQDQ